MKYVAIRTFRAIVEAKDMDDALDQAQALLTFDMLEEGNDVEDLNPEDSFMAEWADWQKRGKVKK